MKSVVLALSLALAAASPLAHAQPVHEFEFKTNAIYPVRTALGITTQIELNPDEVVIDYSTGFTDGWDLTRRDNVFYVRPKNVDVDTNLVVRTQMHTYIFELRVVATDWRALDQAKQAGVHYKVAFRYPDDTKFKVEADTAPALSTVIEPGRAYHFDYDYATRTKLRALVPVSVHDDGQFTYVRMSDATPFPSGSFPAVFGREREYGEDFVVNTTVENNTLIVHGTYRYLVIRHGDNVVGLRRNPVR